MIDDDDDDDDETFVKENRWLLWGGYRSKNQSSLTNTLQVICLAQRSPPFR